MPSLESLPSLIAKARGIDIPSASATETPTSDETPPAEAAETESNPAEETEATESSEASSEADTETDETPKAAADVEEIEVTDDTGRHKLKIDWNDREDIKRRLSMEAGSRKWKSERDHLKRQIAMKDKEYGEKVSALDAITNAFESGGMPALVNLLTGREDGFETWAKREYEKRKMYETGDEKTKAVLDAQAKAEEIERKLNAREAAAKRAADEAAARTKAAEEAEGAALWNSASEAHTIVGKLGDPEAETSLEEALHLAVRKDLQAMGDNPITQKQLNDIFKKHQERLLRVVSKKAEEKTSEIIQKKKDEAGTKLNAAARASARPPTKSEEESVKLAQSKEIDDRVKLFQKFFKKGK